MDICWQGNTCLISDKNGEIRLTIEELLFSDLLLLRLRGAVCGQTEKYFIEELRAGASIHRRVVLDLLGLQELSENACAAICSACRRLLTDCADDLRIIGPPLWPPDDSAAKAFVRMRAEHKRKEERYHV